jgi:hypothetical protein
MALCGLVRVSTNTNQPNHRDNKAMTNPETREKNLAAHLIEQAYFSVNTWIDRGYIVEEDRDAAILASLLKAVQIEAEQHGLTIDRLLREIS